MLQPALRRHKIAALLEPNPAWPAWVLTLLCVLCCAVQVAREVELEDPVENIGAKLVRQVSTELPMQVWKSVTMCGSLSHSKGSVC